VSFSCRSIFRLLAPALLVQALLSAGLAAPAAAQSSDIAPPRGDTKTMLSVCADPANLPYSDDQQPGFENKIADLLATDLHAGLNYTWQRSYRSFLKRTLFAGACDVVIDVPTTLPGLAVTKPYYASSYVAVTRAGDTRHFVSFDDAWLTDAHIGVQLIGADHSATAPTQALAIRGNTKHLTGFAMRTASPAATPQGAIIDAVADGTIDIAFVWGPIAGYFAKAHGKTLRLEKITNDPKNPDLIFSYAMSMGVRNADTALRDRLQGAIDRHQTEIATILSDYGIPIVPIQVATPQSPATEIAQKAGSSPPVR
jgi:mxaJ protein